MTNSHHQIPEAFSDEDDNSENDFATQQLIRLNNSLNTQDVMQQAKAPRRCVPENLGFISTTLAPSAIPTMCNRSKSPTNLSSLNTTRQRPGTSSSDSSPVSATELRVQRDTITRPSDSDTSDNNQERRFSKAIPIARTPSIKQVLAGSFGSNSYTVSTSNSALSSPQLNAMPDLTPLPSPIMANDSPGPWKRRISKSENIGSKTTPLTGDAAFVTPSGELIPSAIANEFKHRAYHGFFLNSDDIAVDSASPKREKRSSNHQIDRSPSDYTPESREASKTCQLAVLDTYHEDLPPEHTLLVDSHMRREPNLALQRGIAPVPRPPTPPSSRTGGESSDSDSHGSQTVKPLVRDYKKRSKIIYFDAVTIANNTIKRWRALKLLGEGTFSKVILATSQLDKDDNAVDEDDASLLDSGAVETTLTEVDARKLVAVKICEHGPKGGASEERVEISLKRELEIMKSIHHPSLVELRAWNVEESRAILVLGYCPGGDLFEVASQRSSILVPSLLQRIFAEIVFAIQYLHERHIVHRDIKLENILVNLPHSELAKPIDWARYPYSIITVTDLGLARHVADDENLTTRCGSDDYAAPEVVMGQPYDGRAVDAWSLGVLLYALLESRLPFDPNPGLSESHKQRSRTSHRIARVEWRWILWEGDEGDHEADIAKFEAAGLKSAMEVTENLLKRARSRWTIDRVAQGEWVKDAIHVDAGIRFRNEDEAETADEVQSL